MSGDDLGERLAGRFVDGVFATQVQFLYVHGWSVADEARRDFDRNIASAR